MKILIVNTSDINSGAARAAYRLHRALLSSNVDSQMLVQTKSSDDYSVIGETTKIRKGINIFRPILDELPSKRYKQRSPTLFSSASLIGSNIVDKINRMDVDIVHLHWINGGMIRIEDLARIKASIVWSLHDMWAFTGGCHYDEECGHYIKACGNCKVLGSNQANDLSAKIHSRKRSVFSSMANLTVIGLSKWLVKTAQESSLFCQTPVFGLPNPIDTKIFSPIDKVFARDLYNLPHDKKLVLFGAMEATSDPRKGFKELMVSLGDVTEDVELIVLGSSQPSISQDFKHKTHYLGRLHDDVSLKVLYSAADIMVVPSLQENLSNAIMESLACGTPVVGFDVGGNSDMIEHQINGYLAKAFDTTDLAKGIEWVLNSPDYESLSTNARNKVMREFDSKIVIKKYISLYHSILNKEPFSSVTRA